jgi:hypothetical protein
VGNQQSMQQTPKAKRQDRSEEERKKKAEPDAVW